MEDKNKLYVGNLAYSMNDEELKAIFAEVGEVIDAKIINDKFSGKSKGFGFVTMVDQAAADKAVKELNGKDVKGFKLRIDLARPMRER